MEESYVWLAGYWLLTRELLLLAAAGVAVSSLDDLLFDILYFARELWRRLTIYRVWARADASTLVGPGVGAPIAVFVPAWDEADVIGQMLATFTRTMRHSRYRIFVGVYPNDPATRAAVDAVADPRIEIVTAPHLGPTTKADCLNAIWHGMEAYERAGIM